MKKLIGILLLCGLMAPTVSWGAAAIAEAVDGAIVSGIKDALGDFAGGLDQEAAASLRAAMEDTSETGLIARLKDTPAFKEMLGTGTLDGKITLKMLKNAAENSLRKTLNTLDTRAASWVNRIITRATEDADKMIDSFNIDVRNSLRTDMMTSGKNFTEATQEADQLMSQLKVLEKSGTSELSGAARGAATGLSAVVGKLNQETSEVLTEAGGEVDTAAADAGSTAAGKVEVPTKPWYARFVGKGKGAYETPEDAALRQLELGAGAKIQKQWNIASRLSDSIEDAAGLVNTTKAAAQKLSGFMRVGADGKSVILEKNLSLAEGDIKGLGKINEGTVDSISNVDGKVTVTVKVGDKTLTYASSDMSAEELGLIKKGIPVKVSKNGRLTIEIADEGAVKIVKAALRQANEDIESAEKDLAQLQKQYSDAAYMVQKAGRLSLKVVKGLTSEITRLPGRLMKVITDLFHKLMEVGKMILQGVFFGVPSMIYQALIQTQQRLALLAQISAPFNITGDFWIQIPPKLISKANPAASAFIYVAVAADGSTNINDTYLSSAQYYVMYQANYPWGSTYATSSTASGNWVHLNSGFTFCASGAALNPQQPCAYLVTPPNTAGVQSVQGAQSTSVEQYLLSAFDNVGTKRVQATFSEEWYDFMPNLIKAAISSIDPDAAIKKLFHPIVTQDIATKDAVNDAGNAAAPQLLIPTLNQFRNGISGVTGFLPATKNNPTGAITIKQFTGIGSLNKLLGNPAVAYDVENALAVLSLPAVQALAHAQQNLESVMQNTSLDSAEFSVAMAALNTAQDAFDAAVVNHPFASGAFDGLDPEFDLNALNVYLYETEDTPIAQFLKKNRPSPLIPAKDYVVFLDESQQNLVPLFIPTLQQVGNVWTIAYDTTQINGAIKYMSSLVSGITYTFVQNGLGQVVMNGDDLNTAIAAGALGQIGAATETTLYGGDTLSENDVLHQVTALANYATALVHEGPLQKGEFLFTRVDLTDMGQNPTSMAAELTSLAAALNGNSQVVMPITATLGLFGSPVSSASQASWLPYIYVYQVAQAPAALSASVTSSSKKSQTTSVASPANPVGALGVDAQGNPIYDYVMLVTPVSGGMQIMPLGIGEALGELTGQFNDYFLVSLVTGMVYDFNYKLLSNPPYSATAVMRNPDFTPIISTSPEFLKYQGQYTTSFLTDSGQEVLAVAVPNLPMATAFLPTFCNPYNVLLSASAVAGSNLSVLQANLAKAEASLSSATSAVVAAVAQDTKNGKRYAQDCWQHLKEDFKMPLSYVQSFVSATTLAAMQAWQSASVAVTTALLAISSETSTLQEQVKPPYSAPRSSDQLLQMAPMYWAHYTKYQYLNQPYSASVALPNQQSAVTSINWLVATPSTAASPLALQSTNSAGTAVTIYQSFAQCVPQQFVKDVLIKTYNEWASEQNANNVVAQVMQAGPFNFTHNQVYNVYLTIAGSNYKAGTYFYQAPLLFGQDLFVIADIDSATPPATLSVASFSSLGGSYLDATWPVIINTRTGDVYMPNSSTYTGPAATTSSGSSGASAVSGTTAAVSTAPAVSEPLAASACMTTKTTYAEKSLCNLIKIGTLNPHDVVLAALQNQLEKPSSDLAACMTELSTLNPGLYSALTNAQLIYNVQQAASLYPVHFAGRTLRLPQEQATNGTYIYAVVNAASDLYISPSVTDYWVTCSLNNVAGGSNNYMPTVEQVTPQTPYMMSLINFNIYQQGSTVPVGNFVDIANSGNNLSSVTTASAMELKMSPLGAFHDFFGTGSFSGYLSAAIGLGVLHNVVNNNSALYNAMENLVAQVDAQYVKSLVTNMVASQNGIQAPTVPVTLQAATEVTFTQLYQDPVTKKYFLYMPNQASDSSSTANKNNEVEGYLYDFNAAVGTAVATPTTNAAGATTLVWSYTCAPQNAYRGVHYQVTGSVNGSTLSISASTPISELVGYPCQAMLAKYGILVDSKGNETVGLPVFNPPLPMTKTDMQLAPGTSPATLLPATTIAAGDTLDTVITAPAGSGFMQCLSIPLASATAAKTGAGESSATYYYYNTAAQMYLARCTGSESVPVVTNTATDTTQTVVTSYDYYVDLMTGEKYQINGHPYLTEVAVAYYVSTAVSALTDPATNDFLNTPSATPAWPVANTQLDFSNPLFIWSDLDMLGESTQQSMMYQNLLPSDPNYGYGQYMIQPGSTSFTVWTPGTTGGSVVYAYSATSSDDNGNPYITTQSGTSAPVVTQQTDMSQALLSALKGGAYLLSKSFVMNVNGAAASSASAGGSSTVTVTETFVAPKQYSVSYSAVSPVANVMVQITDTFQAPVAGQPTGGSQNYYNNPPLDDALQQQLIGGIPFCAQYLGGMTPGQVTSLVTTESPIIQTICGILTKPADPTRYISDSGLLGVVFSGLNANGNLANTNQFFAYYGNYNSGSTVTPSATVGTNQGGIIQLATPPGPLPFNPPAVQTMTGSYDIPQLQTIPATAGQPRPYVSVVGALMSSLSSTTVLDEPMSLQNSAWYNNGSYTALMAGNYVQSIAGATNTGFVQSGAPYLSITGASNFSVSGNNPVSTISATSSATESVYRYSYSTLSNTALENLLNQVNVTTTATGSSYLVSALSTPPQSVGCTNQSYNPAAAAALSSVSYAVPTQKIAGGPAGRYLYQFNCPDSGSSALTSALCSVYPAMQGKMYVDIFNGIVFEQRTITTAESNTGLSGFASVLYPAGYYLDGTLLNQILQQLGNPIPAGPGSLTLQTPTPTASTQKTIPAVRVSS